MRTLAQLSILALAYLCVGGPPAEAQPWSGSVTAGRTYFTGLGGPATAVGATVSYDLSPGLRLSATVEGLGSANTDDRLLLDANSAWHERRHVVGSVDASFFPVRFPWLGAQHRLGLGAGLDARYRDDRLFRGTFYPSYFAATPFTPDEVAIEWRAIGDEYEAYFFDIQDPSITGQVGPHVSLVYPSGGLEAGAHVGVRYALTVGPAEIGVSGVYRRFLDQRVSEGTHAADVRVALGYRW